LRGVAKPTEVLGDPEKQLRPDLELSEARRFTQESVAELLSSTNLTPRQRLSVTKYKEARDGREVLARLAAGLPAPDDYEEPETLQVGERILRSTLKQQMQGALLVFQSGLGSSADLCLDEFDSHSNHDDAHEVLYTHLADAIYYFWDYAEQLGLADRILLVVGSDFGRTNMYNERNGKDHWPIGSYMLMEQGARWGNRVVGASDELHFARKINPSSLQITDDGITLTPAHVHRAVQKYLGIDDFATVNGVALPDVEDIALFSSNKQTRV
jgi:uncharacterized protein (DUF1501 family)